MTPARHPFRWTALTLAALLSACGGGGGDDTVTIDTSKDRGSIQRNPPTQLASLTAAQFTAQLRSSPTGVGLLALAGIRDGTTNLRCGIDLRYLQYGTIGGAGERTNATGAVMIPTGGAGCTGARPIVLHAHGTTTAKDYNIALLGSTTNAAAGEAGLIAALYAAQGMIVVAPNYAGYDASTLGYHPYLNADQQSKDMIDALTAARSALPRIANGTTDSGKLLISGYSQGAHVAMATARALGAGKVTAVAGGSGPYALTAFADDIFGPPAASPPSGPIVGGTLFAPLLTRSWQAAYGNLYSAPSEIYNSNYVDTLLPSTSSVTDLFTQGKLPQAALFDNDLPGAVGVLPFYGTPGTGLIKTRYATTVQDDKVSQPCASVDLSGCAPVQPLRAAAKRNDLRGGWAPAYPVFMCGAAGDPTVFFTNTVRQAAYFATLPLPLGTVSTLDLTTPAPNPLTDPIDGLKFAFQNDASINVTNYHGSVAPYCTAASAGFFAGVLAR